MSQWEKLLHRMANDQKPIGYSYADATRVLGQLGFTLAAMSAGSHRKWSRKTDKSTIVIELVDDGRATMKAYLIRDMIRQLKDNGIIT